MNLKPLLFFLFIIPIQAYGMGTTFQSATPLFPQPRFARNNLSSFEFYTSYDRACASYDQQGNTVGLLNFNGPQDLFKRFVDTSLPYNDTQSFGQASLSGKASSLNYRFNIAQNIGSNFFLTCSAALTKNKIKNALISPINSRCMLLTQDEIDAQPELKSYLKQLSTILEIENGKSVEKSYVGPCFVTCGYTQSLQNFETFDFVDVSIQTGIAFPQTNLDTCKTVLSIIPFINLVNIGIPVLVSCSFGLYDWLNLGASGMVMPFISNDQIIPLNTTVTNNTVLIAQESLCQIQHKPFLYANAYLEFDQCIPHVTLLAGISYAKQYETSYESQDQIMFPDSIINKYPTHKPWDIMNFIASAELDIGNDESQFLPRIKCMYAAPLWGKSIFKRSSVIGELAIELVYDF